VSRSSRSPRSSVSWRHCCGGSGRIRRGSRRPIAPALGDARMDGSRRTYDACSSSRGAGTVERFSWSHVQGHPRGLGIAHDPRSPRPHPSARRPGAPGPAA
jgi:hypothetical protein